MAKSKIAKLCELLDVAGSSGPEIATGVLTRYHAAREAMNACRRKNIVEARIGVSRALRRFNVRVEIVNGFVTVTTFDRSRIWA